MLRMTTLCLAITVLMACNSSTKKENEALKKENQELKMQQEKMQAEQEKSNTTIKYYQKTLKEIESNLASIETGSKKLGQLKEVKTDGDRRKEILERIQSLRTTINNSRNQLSQLDRNLKDLRKQNADKSDEILALSTELKVKVQALLDMEMELNRLTEEMQLKLEASDSSNTELQAILNRAYYYAGTGKQLKDKKIISTEGGFIGLGKSKMINANSDNQLFTKINKQESPSIPLNAEFKSLITQHPKDSYEIQGEGAASILVIYDAESFWKNGNYLVVEVK